MLALPAVLAGEAALLLPAEGLPWLASRSAPPHCASPGSVDGAARAAAGSGEPPAAEAEPGRSCRTCWVGPEPRAAWRRCRLAPADIGRACLRLSDWSPDPMANSRPALMPPAAKAGLLLRPESCAELAATDRALPCTACVVESCKLSMLAADPRSVLAGAGLVALGGLASCQALLLTGCDRPTSAAIEEGALEYQLAIDTCHECLSLLCILKDIQVWHCCAAAASLTAWHSEVHCYDEGLQRGPRQSQRPAALHGASVIPELANETASSAPASSSLASVSEDVDAVLAWLADLLARLWLRFSSAAKGTGLGDAGDGSSEGLLLFLWALPGL